MKLDPTDELLTFFYEGLNGQLIYDGTTYSIYATVPDNESNYVHLRSLTGVDASTKTDLIWDCSLTVDVIF